MFRFGMKSDTIQFGIFVTGLLSILGAMFGWAQAHFDEADVTSVKVQGIIRSQTEGRAERIEYQNKLMDKLVTIDERLGRIEGRLSK